MGGDAAIQMALWQTAAELAPITGANQIAGVLDLNTFPVLAANRQPFVNWPRQPPGF